MRLSPSLFSRRPLLRWILGVCFAVSTAVAESAGPAGSREVEELLAPLTPGAILAGPALSRTGAPPIRVFLEVVECSLPQRRMLARVRNAGGWHEFRTVTGSWHGEPVDGALELAFQEGSDGDVLDGGPLLSSLGQYGIVGKLMRGGRYEATVDEYRLPLSLLSAAEAAVLRQRQALRSQQLVSPFQPGTVYREHVEGRSADTEAVQIRFTELNLANLLVAAILEVPGQAGQRALSGYIIDNSFRDGGRPLRLRLDPIDAVPGAPYNSVLVSPFTTQFSFTTEGGVLVGETTHRSLRLQRIGGPTEPVPLETFLRDPEREAVGLARGERPPDCPAGRGLYAFVDGSWHRLPNSGGHAVAVGPPERRQIELRFTATEPLPRLPRHGALLRFRGRAHPLPPTVPAGHAVAEAARTFRGVDGTRRVPLTQFFPGALSFAPDRMLPLAQEWLEEDVLELVPPAGLQPANYVVSVSDESFEFRVD